MDRNTVRDWQKDHSCIKENFEENHKGLEEDLIPCPEKDMWERYLDNSDESMYLFKGAIYGLLFCLPFWTILIWLIS